MIQLIPFRLAAGVVTKISAGTLPWSRTRLYLVPLFLQNSDPVYMWIGRDTLADADALKLVRPAAFTTPDYDLAASAYNTGRRSWIETDASGVGVIQLFSPTGIAEGFIHAEECDEDYANRVAVAVANELAKRHR